MLILSQYNWGVYIIEEKNEAALYDLSQINVDELSKELINDIESDLDGWSIEFSLDDGAEEIEQYKNNIIQRIEKLRQLI